MKFLTIAISFKIIQILLFSFGLLSSFEVSAQEVKLRNGWVFSPQVDKMTDQNRSWFSKDKGAGSIFFKCFGNGRYEPVWLFGKYLTSGATFMYRFDKDVAIRVDSGQMFTTHKSLFLDDQIGFVERALSAKIIILQARDRDGDTVTHEFELEGLKDAVEHANRVAPCR
jgi:hypothetical protein